MIHRPSGPVRTLLGRAVVLTVLAGLVCAVVASVAVGRDGVLAAVVGVCPVLGFLLVGQLPIVQVARGRRVLGAALLVSLYSTRLLLLLLAWRVLSASDTVDRRTLGLTVVVCALAWTTGTVWSAMRWQPVLIEPEPSPAPGEVVRP